MTETASAPSNSNTPSPIRRKIFSGFRAKITLAFILSFLIALGLSDFLIFKVASGSQFQQLREQLMVIAQTSTLIIDAEELARIPLNRSGLEMPEFLKIHGQLQQIKDLNPLIKYVYTLTGSEDPDHWQFIVDLDPELRAGKQVELTAYPGDPYNVRRFPEMLEARKGPSADTKLMADEWGVTLSGYAPVRDKSGRVVAVMGIDMDARDVAALGREIWQLSIYVGIAGILISIFLGFTISGQIADRIQKVVEGTRHLARDELGYRVEVQGHDEVSELAESFNIMAKNILDSRKQLEDYFFRVVQSLVRILEAKDPYTRGHSERVGHYASLLAARMGLSKEEIDLLRIAGELHDIGKMGVSENILNKPGPLTPEEWEKIRQHPIIGGESVKPVFYREEIIMLGIRQHHEHYDGRGYPDKLKGEEISLYAQIISVADAYDAMTSDRAYRKALGKAVAVAELKKNTGGQFSPVVVDSFLKVLDESIL